MTDGILLAETQRDPLLGLRHDHHRRGARAQPQHRLPAGLPEAAAAAPARPEGRRHLRHHRRRSASRSTSPFRQGTSHRPSCVGPAPSRSSSATGPSRSPREYDLEDAIADAVDELWSRLAPGTATSWSSCPASARSARPPTTCASHLLHQPGCAMPRCCRSSPGSARPSRTASSTATRPAHRAGHQRGRDLAHRARHPLRDRRGHRARQALQPAQQGRAAADRAISQAAANQRAGPLRPRGQRHLHPPLRRGGFQGPPAFHRPRDPALSPGRRDPAHEARCAWATVARFPFVEPPSGRAIADGYQLLAELGAVDDNNELTPTGRELSKLPLDPRVGRMILEARTRGALDEVLVIASALSVQDVRDRPHGAAGAGGPGACQVRRREERVQRLPAPVEVAAMRPPPVRRCGWPSAAPGARTRRCCPSRSAPWRRPLPRRQWQWQRQRQRPPTSSATASTSSCCGRTSSACAACASGATSTASC
jgi:ATP-dependent helicase HrpA